MIGDSDDLLLKLMQIADDPDSVPPPAPGNNPLSAIKPYPYHLGECGGMIEVQIGAAVDEDDDEGGELVARLCCIKCRKDEIVPAKLAMTPKGPMVDFEPPAWVGKPAV